MSESCKTDPHRERFVLTVEALPDDAPAVVRLRRVCKALLRHYGFRLVDAREVPAAAVGAVGESGDGQ